MAHLIPGIALDVDFAIAKISPIDQVKNVWNYVDHDANRLKSLSHIILIERATKKQKQ